MHLIPSMLMIAIISANIFAMHELLVVANAAVRMEAIMNPKHQIQQM